MEMLARSLGFGVLLPGAVAAVTSMAATRYLTRSDLVSRTLANLGVASAVALAYAALDLGPIVPADSWHWLPCLALAAAVLSVIDRPPWLAVAVRAVMSGAVAWLVVPVWEANEPWRMPARIGLGLAVFAVWSLDRGRAEPRDRWRCALLSLAAGVGAGVLMLGGTARFAQMSGALAAAMAGTAVVGPPGLLPVVAVLMPGIMATGYFNTFSELPAASYALPVVAATIPDLAARLPRGQRIVATVGVILTLAAAIGLAMWYEPVDWAAAFPTATPDAAAPTPAP